MARSGYDAVVLGSILALAAIAATPAAPAAPEDPLALVLAGVAAIPFGTEPILKVRLENHGPKREVAIAPAGGSTEDQWQLIYEWEVIDPYGRSTRKEIEHGSAGRPLLRARDFHRLGPGEAFEFSEQLGRRFAFERSGTYRVRVNYVVNPERDAFESARREERKEVAKLFKAAAGRIATSNEIKVRVEDPDQWMRRRVATARQLTLGTSQDRVEDLFGLPDKEMPSDDGRMIWFYQIDTPARVTGNIPYTAMGGRIRVDFNLKHQVVGFRVQPSNWLELQ
jgi:hypothetical protein